MLLKRHWYIIEKGSPLEEKIRAKHIKELPLAKERSGPRLG